jgi:hypothetical protein
MFEKKDGCVYFFKHKGLEPIKVGYSTKNSPEKRFIQFCTYAPFGGEIVAFEKSSIAYEVERAIHKKYAHKRLNGEWFDISMDEIKQEIELIKKYETLHK